MELEDDVSKLEKQALARKEKLKDLKRKRECESGKGTSKEVLPQPKFRSYKPQSEQLTEQELPLPKPEDVVSEVKSQLESAKSGISIDQLDISTLAPRKQDWDLKRDIAKKLEYLERQTQKAIAELIREELKKRQNLSEVASLEMVGSKLV